MTWKFMREKTQRNVPNADMDAHGGGQGEAPGDVSLAVELNTRSLWFSAQNQSLHFPLLTTSS